MAPLLHFLLMTYLALTATAYMIKEKCNNDSFQNATEDRWTVLMELRLPYRFKISMNLNLSHTDEMNTTLDLLHGMAVDGLLQATLTIPMAKNDKKNVKLATNLPDSSLSTLIIAARPREVKLRIESELPSVKYSSRALVTTNYDILPVDTVFFTGPKCDGCINLKCFYSKKKYLGNKKISIAEAQETNDYSWAFYSIITLLVVVIVLLFVFLVWRNEKKKFRARWSRHSRNMSRMSSGFSQKLDSPQTSRRDVVEWQAEPNNGRINLAYDSSGDIK